jgi:hypothetical protein
VTDIVLVPTYFRPEFLQLCLEHLAEAEGIESKEIWLLQDSRPDDEHVHKLEMGWTASVVNAWKGSLNLQFIVGQKHGAVGNTRNVLEGYKRAYHEKPRYVYLVEDDVFVTPDFFKWHEAVQADGDYFCTVGCNCSYKKPEKIKLVRDLSAYYTAAWYASLGVCWKPENMGEFLKHALTTYYNNMDGYIAGCFPDSPLGTGFTEQDGLINRVILQSGKKVAFPFVSRAYHAGFYGYHRDVPLRPNGFLEAKIQGLRKLLSDPDIYASPSANPWSDCEMFPEDLTFSEWSSIVKKTEEF